MPTTILPQSSPVAQTSVVTPEQMLDTKTDGLFELVDGRLVEKKMGYAANLTAGEITWALKNYVKSTHAGDVLPEQSFQCFPHEPSQVRRPDVAFILAARVPAEYPAGHVTIVPDLAVEVVSPNDDVYALDEKLEDYHLAAIPMTWVVNPNSRVIRIHRPNQPVQELRDGDTLTGDPLFPGFSAKVTDLLPRLMREAPQP